MAETKHRYHLAHPLDEGNPFTKDGKPQAGDTDIALNENEAAHLAAAGYLNLDENGKAKVVTAS